MAPGAYSNKLRRDFYNWRVTKVLGVDVSVTGINVLFTLHFMGVP